MSENKVKRIKQTINIPVRDLHPHPKNPRKNLGDLEELTDSIKKNGIMQNLTVIPGFYRANGEWFNTEAEYTVIIGHRRLEAAKAAGLTEVPCRIYENLPENDQIATMLEENMQRNDLTIYEQAQSFQLMLDLGETVDTLSEKTGFAKSTIYHRINIAKLDQEYLKELDEDDSFQLTLNDLIELEKIKDIKKRDKILKESRSSNDLRFKAQQAAKEEMINAKEKQWREYLEDSLADEGEQSMKWSGRYEKVFEQDLREDKEFDPEEVEGLINDETYYIISYGYVTLLQEKVNEAAGDEDDDDDEEESEWERKRRERDERKQIYTAVRLPLKEDTRDFVRAIVEEKLKNPDKEDIANITETLFKLFLETFSTYSVIDDLIEFLDEDIDTRDEETEEYKKAHDKVMKLPMYKLLLILAQNEINDTEPLGWDGEYKAENAQLMQRFYYILERWDWKTSEEAMKLINGTADYYTHKDEEDE